MTQPASQSVSLGQSAKLSCTRSSGGGWGGYFAWYQQKAGQAPRFVLYGTSSRGEGIPDRFTGSSSGNDGYLTITNVQPEDEADYYCAHWYSTGSVFHSDTFYWGTETKTFTLPLTLLSLFLQGGETKISEDIHVVCVFLNQWGERTSVSTAFWMARTIQLPGHIHQSTRL